MNPITILSNSIYLNATAYSLLYGTVTVLNQVNERSILHRRKYYINDVRPSSIFLREIMCEEGFLKGKKAACSIVEIDNHYFR